MSPKFYVTVQVEGARRLPQVSATLQDYGFEPQESQGLDGRPMLTAADILILPDTATLISYTDELAAWVWRANGGPCVVRVLPVVIPERTTELVRGPADYARFAAHILPDAEDAAEEITPGEGSA